MAIIETHQLTREYIVHSGSGWRRQRRAIAALTDLNLVVQPGESLGYLGANGSGKSTTIKMLAGILTPTSGRVRCCGLDPAPSRRQLARRIGVVFGQRSQLWWDLPLAESYPILGAMHRMSSLQIEGQLKRLTDALDLGDFLSTPVRQLSLGQRMRGEVAAALLHSPELVILDEPTIGLDMISKEALRQFLNSERAERGTTLVLTTHDLGDVQRLCDRMVIIDRGRLAFDGSEADLQAVTGAKRVLVVDVGEAEPIRVEFGPDESAAQALASVSAKHEVRSI